MKKRLRKYRQVPINETIIFKSSFKLKYVKLVARPVDVQIKLDEIYIHCTDKNIPVPSPILLEDRLIYFT